MDHDKGTDGASRRLRHRARPTRVVATRPAGLIALAALAAVLVTLGSPAPSAAADRQVLASGRFRVTLPPRADEFVAFPYPKGLRDLFYDYYGCAQGTVVFSWRITRPKRLPSDPIRVYWHYRGYRTLGARADGRGMFNVCFPLYVTNRTRSTVIIEIRYQVVRIVEGPSGI